MEQVIRPLVVYTLFLVVVYFLLKYFHRKDTETAILEYKIDAYLNGIKQDIVSGFFRGEYKESMTIMERSPEPSTVPTVPIVPTVPTEEPEKVLAPVPVAPYSVFLNTFYLVNKPQDSIELKSTQVIK